jgi:hypothetical protein
MKQILPFNKRSSYDYYPTPRIAVDLLLKNIKFDGNIYECACGEGHISKILQEYNYNVISSDIRTNDSIYGDKNIDFLLVNNKVDNILTNPPYLLAEKFIKHGLDLVNKKMVYLLRLSFLETIKRAELFNNTPLNYIYLLSKRLKLINDNNMSSQFAQAWFIWDKQNYDGNIKIKFLY